MTYDINKINLFIYLTTLSITQITWHLKIWLLENNKLKGTREEAVVICSKILHSYLAAVTEKSQKKFCQCGLSSERDFNKDLTETEHKI